MIAVKHKTKICTRCIYDENVPGIRFDEQGVCSYCHMVDDLAQRYHTGLPEGQRALQEIIDQVKAKGKGNKYDCIVGVSGGTDSSFLLAKCIEWGLRPLAVHYDNTWNSAIATENIRKVTTKLKVDLYTYVVSNKEADDIFRAFFLASVPELDCSTDIAYAQVLRMAASKHKIKYIFEGHSFIAEGVSPIGMNYFDGQYIKDIHKQYGKLKLKTFPNMDFWQFMKWTVVKQLKFIRPLWYIHYSKDEAKQFLKENFGWEYYGGHHLENRSAAFLHSVYNPVKFKLDNRNWTLAASVRAGLLSHEDACRMYYEEQIVPDKEIVEYFKKRTGLSDEEYERVMKGPNRNFRAFKTYKKRFERLRPLFKILVKAQLVPISFYLKYCFPLPVAQKV